MEKSRIATAVVAAGVVVLATLGAAGFGASAHGAPAPGASAPGASAPGASARNDALPRWSWPVVPARVVGAYAAPPTRYAAGHRGIDLAAEAGAEVLAPDDASVRFAGVVVDRPVLTLEHASGVLSSYEPVTVVGLSVGDQVARGTVVGVVGEGAHCSGGCLHVGVRVDGEYVSPLLFFDRVPRSVLLPLRSAPVAAGRLGGPEPHARGWAMR